MPQGESVIQCHDRFMIRNYPRLPITMAEGRGCELIDAAGNTYLDLFSGFGAGILGHCHPDLIDAATQQAQRLWHAGNLLHTEPQVALAEHIAAKGFNGRSFFCHSGSDANEAAFKLARLYGRGERHKILATGGSFHGRGFAAMMATGQEKVREGFAPFLPGFDHVPFNDANAIANAVDDQTVAVIVEPIQGEGGVVVPDERYLSELRRICDEHDLLLIVDEVWTGCGRTGRWFAYQHAGIEPDILTLGKAVGAGLPVGVMCAADRIAAEFDFETRNTVPHATTLGGSCVPMAVSARMFEVIERDGLLQRAEDLGRAALDRMRQWLDRYPVVADVRGRGLFLGVELNLEGSRFESAGQVVRAGLDQGILLGAAQQNVVRLAPPLTISDAELDRGLSLLEPLLAEE